MTTSGPVSLHTTPVPGGVRLHVGGEIDIANAEHLRHALDQAISQHDRVEVDLGGVTFIDSHGLRVLVAAHGVVAPEQGAFTIVNASRQVRRAFTVTGLDLAYHWPSERH